MIDVTYGKAMQLAAEHRLAGTQLASCQRPAWADSHVLSEQVGDEVMSSVWARNLLFEHQEHSLQQCQHILIQHPALHACKMLQGSRGEAWSATSGCGGGL